MPVTNRPSVQLDTKLWDVHVPSNAWPVTLRVARINFQSYQVQGAIATANVDITPFPAGLEILGAFFMLSRNFLGGTVGTATLSAGTTGSPAAYIAATSVFAGAPKQMVGLTQVPGTFLNTAGTPAAGTVRVQLIVNTTVNQLTQGSADLYMRLSGSDLRIT